MSAQPKYRKYRRAELQAPESEPQRPFASFGARAGAWAINALIGVVATIPAYAITVHTWARDGLHRHVVLSNTRIVVGLFVGLVLAIFDGRTGQTPGRKLLGIRLVSARDELPIGVPRGIARWAVDHLPLLALGLLTKQLAVAPALILIVPLVAYLWMLGDRKSQTLFDKVVGSIVVVDR